MLRASSVIILSIGGLLKFKKIKEMFFADKLVTGFRCEKKSHVLSVVRQYLQVQTKKLVVGVVQTSIGQGLCTR